jgi:WS/DGAT/MGAT family acyltransferase
MPLASGLPGAHLVARTARTLNRLVSGETRPSSAPPTLGPMPVPRTTFNGPISADRVFSYGSLPLGEVKRIAQTFGIGANDVVMALCSSALRTWLQRHDALPDQPLIAAVPVAVRGTKGPDTVGNQISAMVAPLATDIACPKERLHAIGKTMLTAKRRFVIAPATWLHDLSSLVPAPLTAFAAANLARLAGITFPPINLIISNVPGPRTPLYVCGAKVVSCYPISVISDASGGLNITCFSYDDSLSFGIVSCPRRAPHAGQLIDDLRNAMSELTVLAEAERSEPALASSRS